MSEEAELLPGTLDLLILKAVSLGPLHGYAVLSRIEADFRKAVVRGAGSVVSGLVPARASGIAQDGVGEIGKQQASEILRADGKGP